MKKIRIGINGFGRIGRIAARIILERKNLELKFINSRTDANSHAYLLKYDSTYGILPKKVEAKGNLLLIDNNKVLTGQFALPAQIPWNKAQVDLVLDTSGKFRSLNELNGHLRGSVKQVILSAPAKDEMPTFVMGVNNNSFQKDKDRIISNSSCTTNCLATTLKVLDDNFAVESAFMTTTHAVTDSQNLLDNSHSGQPRLRRSAISSIIPAATGSARDIVKIYPKLRGKIYCQALRVPTTTVSLINLTAKLKRKAEKAMINKAFENAAKGKLKGILTITQEELVSTDYKGNPSSAIVDTYLTQITDDMANIYAWYDNEWGYATRLVDMAEFTAGS